MTGTTPANTTEAPAVAGRLDQPVRLVSTWMGRPLDELSREELLQVVEWCGREIQQLREARDRWRNAADPIKYLMAGGTRA